MNLGKTAKLALLSLSRNRLRSFLMMLGVTVGIASLTALASVGEATKQETMRRFKRMLGTFDMVIIEPGGASTRGMPSLTTVGCTNLIEFGPNTSHLPASRAVTTPTLLPEVGRTTSWA